MWWFSDLWGLLHLMYFDPCILYKNVVWLHFQQFLHWGTPGFILALWMVTMYLPTLKHLLMSILALLLLWTFHMSIQTIDMSNLGETLITLGLDTKLTLLKIWFCLRTTLTSLEVRQSWELPWEKKEIPMILRYDFNWGRCGSST